jgi:pimeloyl-ACP methyl ester carboxylesterase
MKQLKCLALLAIFVLLLTAGTGLYGGETKAVKGTVKSFDNVTIHYEVSGKEKKGDPTLVFVHCWCCDRSYWSSQLPYFSQKYKVVAIDLAGHGESGLNRKEWSPFNFAQDVTAVVNKLGLKKVILIGHSMGGAVIAETALLIPGKVIGLVPVDTFQDVEQKFTKEQFEQFMAPFRTDFVKGTRGFIRGFMFPSGADPKLIDKIANDMSSAPPEVGIGAMEEGYKVDLPAVLDKVKEKVKAPIYCVNADKFPTNVEAGKRHAVSFKIKILPNTGHFLMMEKPDAFNKLLEEALKELMMGE